MSRYIDAKQVSDLLGNEYLERLQLSKIRGNESQEKIATGINYSRNIINDKIPTADVQEVKHGKWREGRFGNGLTVSFSKYYICDQCSHTSEKKSRYCSYCGAKMYGK